MAIILEENHDLPLCKLQITQRVGSTSDQTAAGTAAYGGPALSGLCNFASELERRGAGGRTRAEIDEQLDSLGAGLQILCWHDQVLYEVMSLREHFERAVEILADVVLRPDFPMDEGERLRRELLANLDELRDDDSGLLHRFFGRELYGDTPYGRPVAGTEESTMALSLPAAKAWHSHHTVRGNLVVGAAGAISGSEAESLMQRYFSTLPDGPRRDEPIPSPRARKGRKVLIVDKPERTQSQILIGQLAPHWKDPSWLPLHVSTMAFGGTFTARLMDEVRAKRGLSYGASARLGNGRGIRSLYAHVFPSAEQTAETIDLVLRLYEEWAEKGLRPGELDFVKSYLQKSHAFTVQTADDRLNLRTRLQVCDMPEDDEKTYPDRVARVSEADIQRAMASFLHPDDLLITLVATADTVLPSLQKLPGLRNAEFEVVPHDSF
ncbi:MAG TPA: pitrilysin family protein [Pseudomonadota bacterium]|nr:pitrilysin family protein [Pseudomonadota bacterium]